MPAEVALPARLETASDVRAQPVRRLARQVCFPSVGGACSGASERGSKVPNVLKQRRVIVPSLFSSRLVDFFSRFFLF